MVCQGVIVHIRVLIGIKGEDWKASRLLLQTQCIAEINLLKECRKSDKEKKMLRLIEVLRMNAI